MSGGERLYQPALDGIRGVAIVWVVFHNATDRAYGRAHGLSYLLMAFANTGWIGVQLFFALSGFLITAGLLATQRNPHYLRDFYAKRALRILPLYYSVLIGFLLVWPAISSVSPLRTDGQWALWTFVSNWTHVVPYGFAHFWSLAIEEQFYLLWPFVVGHLVPRRLLVACVAIALGSLLVRAGLSICGADWWSIYTNTACRMDALALGSAVACLPYLLKQRDWFVARLRPILTCALLLSVLGVPLTHVYSRMDSVGQTIGYSILAVCSAVLVAAAAAPGVAGGLWLRTALATAPLRSLGKYSYGIYVFHNLLHRFWGDPWMVAHFGEHPATALILAYALGILVSSYLIAICSYQLLEKRFLRLKRRFEWPAPEVRGVPFA